MEQQGFVCSGDCLKCIPAQRQYCSSQMTYNATKMLEHLIADVNKMVEMMQNNEKNVFNPTAQQG